MGSSLAEQTGEAGAAPDNWTSIYTIRYKIYSCVRCTLFMILLILGYIFISMMAKLFFFNLLLTAWDHSPPRTNFLKVPAVGWSSLQPASCMRTSALVFSPMLVRCCPISRTISWSVDDKWLRRFTFRTRADAARLDSSEDETSFSSSLTSGAMSPRTPSSREAPLLEPPLCLFRFFWSFILRFLPPLLCPPPVPGGESSLASKFCEDPSSSLIMLDDVERVFAALLTVATTPELLRWLRTRFLGGDCEVDMRGGPRARRRPADAAHRWSAGTKPHRRRREGRKKTVSADSSRCMCVCYETKNEKKADSFYRTRCLCTCFLSLLV